MLGMDETVSDYSSLFSDNSFNLLESTLKLNNTDDSSPVEDEDRACTSIIIPDEVQNAADRVNKCYEEGKKRLELSCKSEFLLNTLEHILYDTKNEIPKSIRRRCSEKLQDIKLLSSVTRKHNLLDILGIEESTLKQPLNTSEKKTVTDVFFKELMKRTRSFKHVAEHIEDLLCAPSSSSLLQDVSLHDTFSELHRRHRKVNVQFDTIIRLINDILYLKLMKLQPLLESEVLGMNVQLESLNLEANTLKNEIGGKVITENPEIENAAEKLKEISEVELNKTRTALNKLTSRQEEYLNLQGTEFESILQTYTNVRNDLKKTSCTLQALRRTE